MRQFVLVIAAATAFASTPAFAAPCNLTSPFDDVAASEPFCSNVEWLANRSITAGCAAGLYCPGDPVTRAQMALFLNRLAVALAPQTFMSVGGFLDDFDPPVVLCQTGDIPITAYPRVMHAISIAHLEDPSAPMVMQVRLVYSFGPGSAWHAFGPSQQGSSFASLQSGQSPPHTVTLTNITPDVALNVGDTVRVGVEFQRWSGAGTLTVGCQLRVRLENRNASMSPH